MCKYLARHYREYHRFNFTQAIRLSTVSLCANIWLGTIGNTTNVSFPDLVLYIYLSLSIHQSVHNCIVSIVACFVESSLSFLNWKLCSKTPSSVFISYKTQTLFFSSTSAPLSTRIFTTALCPLSLASISAVFPF